MWAELLKPSRSNSIRLLWVIQLRYFDAHTSPIPNPLPHKPTPFGNTEQIYFEKYFFISVIPYIFVFMSKKKVSPPISRRTKKEVLVGKYIKINPLIEPEVQKRVDKGEFPSVNNAMNVTLEKEFLKEKK